MGRNLEEMAISFPFPLYGKINQRPKDSKLIRQIKFKPLLADYYRL